MAYIETIEPATGRRESLWVMLSIALILFMGAVGLHYNSAEEPDRAATSTPELTPAQRQLVMELSIALPEINFELEASGELPSVALLSELEVAPFDAEQAGAAWRWQRVQQRCYLATPESPEQGYFLFQPDQAAVYLSSEAPHAAASCTIDHEWTRVNRPARNTP